MHDPPAGDDPAGHIASVPIPPVSGHSLVVADISRYKRVIGDALRARTDARRNTEGAIAVQALNRMLEFGRPEYVRIA